MAEGVPSPADIAALDIALVPAADLPALPALWTDLEHRAEGSFFLSWLWIGCWLEHLPPGSQPHVLVARQRGTVVGLAVLCRRTARRLGLWPVRRWLLHETGDPLFDRLTVEYNGILADRSWAEPVTEACLSWLMRRLPACDELALGGLDAAAERRVRAVAGAAGQLLRAERASSAHFVDLERLRRTGADYLAGRGPNTRAAIGRALRLYGRRGPLTLHAAADAVQAADYLAALERLHQARWQARGQPGAFADPGFRAFHRRLVERAQRAGALRLCRITAGGEDLGYLYNFVWRGRVLNYQSGFAFEPDNRLKPGLVSHYLAVEDALGRGDRCYDLMAGAAGHKPLLATDHQAMTWLAVAPDRPSRRLEAGLRALRGRLAGQPAPHPA